MLENILQPFKFYNSANTTLEGNVLNMTSVVMKLVR